MFYKHLLLLLALVIEFSKVLVSDDCSKIKSHFPAFSLVHNWLNLSLHFYYLFYHLSKLFTGYMSSNAES